MWKVFLKLVVLMTICFSLSESQSDLIEFMEKRQSKRYCGNKLVDMVRLVCSSVYYTPSPKSTTTTTTTQIPSLDKKSDDAGDDFWMQRLIQESEDQYYMFPFQSEARAHNILKRYPRGIANECCIYKGCTIEELMSYCGK
uniref:ILP3 n=1 Tax=Blattella germanica TaxID=6973 RepID=A0A445MQK3_BLAGE|nr:ILP3 [Blattella germanica]